MTKKKIEQVEPTSSESPTPNAELETLKAQIEALTKQNEENQKTMKMLYEVADRGRVMNYESNQAVKKPFRVKLAKYNGGIIVGWRTIRDTLVKNPTTGRTVGEEQEYELLISMPDGSIAKQGIIGYPAFSDARYTERVECEVRGKREDFDGKITFDVSLPDGREVSLDSRFVN